MPLVALLALLEMVKALAAWPWIMLTAVAAVPLVPLTVRPTTLLTVGVMVLVAVLPGAWTMAPTLPAQLPQVGATPAPPDTRQEPVPTSDSLLKVVAAEA